MLLTFLLKHSPTPLQKLDDPLFEEKKIHFYLKRDDLIHEAVSGNKWRKLKYNLEEAQRLGKKTLLTFGGAFSNHIYATAAAGKLAGFRTVGIIRGEEHLPLNPTLRFAQLQEMELHYLSRSEYREKKSEEVINQLKTTFGDFYLIPEGGSNALALPGCAEIIPEIEVDFDVFACACGTGGTLAGVLTAMPSGTKALGFSALKGGEFLKGEVESLLSQTKAQAASPWEIVTDYHFGGYAKATPELLAFKDFFETQFNLPIEPVYTAKMLYGLFDMIRNDAFPIGTTLIALHTGGLQVNKAGSYRK